MKKNFSKKLRNIIKWVYGINFSDTTNDSVSENTKNFNVLNIIEQGTIKNKCHSLDIVEIFSKDYIADAANEEKRKTIISNITQEVFGSKLGAVTLIIAATSAGKSSLMTTIAKSKSVEKILSYRCGDSHTTVINTTLVASENMGLENDELIISLESSLNKIRNMFSNEDIDSVENILAKAYIKFKNEMPKKVINDTDSKITSDLTNKFINYCISQIEKATATTIENDRLISIMAGHNYINDYDNISVTLIDLYKKLFYGVSLRELNLLYDTAKKTITKEENTETRSNRDSSIKTYFTDLIYESLQQGKINNNTKNNNIINNIGKNIVDEKFINENPNLINPHLNIIGQQRDELINLIINNTMEEMTKELKDNGALAMIKSNDSVVFTIKFDARLILKEQDLKKLKIEKMPSYDTYKFKRDLFWKLMSNQHNKMFLFDKMGISFNGSETVFGKYTSQDESDLSNYSREYDNINVVSLSGNNKQKTRVHRFVDTQGMFHSVDVTEDQESKRIQNLINSIRPSNIILLSDTNDSNSHKSIRVFNKVLTNTKYEASVCLINTKSDTKIEEIIKKIDNNGAIFSDKLVIAYESIKEVYDDEENYNEDEIKAIVKQNIEVFKNDIFKENFDIINDSIKQNNGSTNKTSKYYKPKFTNKFLSEPIILSGVNKPSRYKTLSMYIMDELDVDIEKSISKAMESFSKVREEYGDPKLEIAFDSATPSVLVPSLAVEIKNNTKVYSDNKLENKLCIIQNKNVASIYNNLLDNMNKYIAWQTALAAKEKAVNYLSVHISDAKSYANIQSYYVIYIRDFAKDIYDELYNSGLLRLDISKIEMPNINTLNSDYEKKLNDKLYHRFVNSFSYTFGNNLMNYASQYYNSSIYTHSTAYDKFTHSIYNAFFTSSQSFNNQVVSLSPNNIIGEIFLRSINNIVDDFISDEFIII